VSVDTFNDSNRIHGQQHSLYPINICSSALSKDDDNATVITSNISSDKRSQKPYKTQAFNHIVQTENAGFAGLRLDTNDAITDSGATQIFVMDGTPVINKCPTTHPLKVVLADGRIVLSTHMCDINIDGLPAVLTGHIIPDLSIASLIGIHIGNIR